jgi:hypothetical protein
MIIRMTFWYGGKPNRDIFPMSSSLLIKSWELWLHILKRREFLAFSITCVYKNLCCSRLGMENLEMLINIYKNWPKDARVRGSLST